MRPALVHFLKLRKEAICVKNEDAASTEVIKDIPIAFGHINASDSIIKPSAR